MNTNLQAPDYRRRPDSERQCAPVSIDELEIPPTRRCFGLRVRGDAMAGRHILEGDIVFVDPDRTPSSGRVVAALIDGEPVLRTFVVEGSGRGFLRAENQDYPRQIPVRELVIQGVVVGLVRYSENRNAVE